MAGNHDRNRIVAVGPAHSPNRLGIANRHRDIPIRTGLSIRDLEQGIEHLRLKHGRLGCEGKIELLPVTLKVFTQLAFDLTKMFV